MKLSQIGTIAKKLWLEILNHFDDVISDE